MKKLTTVFALCTAMAFGAAAFAQGASLNKKEARDLITAHGQDFRMCYDGAVKGKGRVRARVTLDSKGTLSHSEKVTGDLDNASLNSCMAGVFEKMDAKPVERGAVTVSFPFNFGE